MKTCTECGHRRPLTEFYRKAAAKDGRTPQCKPCRKARDKKKYAANRTKLVEQQKQYRRDNAAELKRRRKGQYARMTPQQKRTKLAGNHRWLKNHPEKNANYVAKRRARVKNAPVIELIDRLTVYVNEDGVCYLCEKDVPVSGFHLEHVIPLSKGGEHSYRNVRIACPTCNSRKGASYACA